MLFLLPLQYVGLVEERPYGARAISRMDRPMVKPSGFG